MSKVKDATRTLIIDEATKLFMKKSVLDVKMAEIAVDVGLGEATLYRYFGKKQNLVCVAAAKQYQILFEEFKQTNLKGSGLEKIKSMYIYFLTIFKKKPFFYNFIYELDAYILREPNVNKTEYEDTLIQFKEVFMEAYRVGLEDNSINPVPDAEVFYYSTTHALMNLCKKLAHDGALLDQDSKLNKELEIKELINIILFRLSPYESNISEK